MKQAQSYFDLKLAAVDTALKATTSKFIWNSSICHSKLIQKSSQIHLVVMKKSFKGLPKVIPKSSGSHLEGIQKPFRSHEEVNKKSFKSLPQVIPKSSHSHSRSNSSNSFIFWEQNDIFLTLPLTTFHEKNHILENSSSKKSFDWKL